MDVITSLLCWIPWLQYCQEGPVFQWLTWVSLVQPTQTVLFPMIERTETETMNGNVCCKETETVEQGCQTHGIVT